MKYPLLFLSIKNCSGFLGIAALANINTAGAKETDIKLFHHFDPAFAGGFSFTINRVARNNVGNDYAAGFYGSQDNKRVRFTTLSQIHYRVRKICYFILKIRLIYTKALQ